MIQFDIGVSALNASQQAISVIGENIANASTPGYHRQVADLVSNLAAPVGGLLLGTGVHVATVNQLRDSLLESAITSNTSGVGNTKAQLDTLNQLEATFGQGAGTLGSDLEDFFNQLRQLAAQPQSTTLRRVVISSAVTLTGEFNSLA